MNRSSIFRSIVLSDVGILILLVLVRILLQVFTNGQYGFHQDELVTIDIATRHLAWGYVAWPVFWQRFPLSIRRCERDLPPLIRPHPAP
jgi:hypothetical protein